MCRAQQAELQAALNSNLEEKTKENGVEEKASNYLSGGAVCLSKINGKQWNKQKMGKYKH